MYISPYNNTHIILLSTPKLSEGLMWKIPYFLFSYE